MPNSNNPVSINNLNKNQGGSSPSPTPTLQNFVNTNLSAINQGSQQQRMSKNSISNIMTVQNNLNEKAVSSISTNNSVEFGGSINKAASKTT